jgi:alcohol dehydrogenase YqhD (iron-dependent ADH family)
VNEFGLSSVLILYGSDRIKRDGLFDRVSTSQQGQCVSYEELGGVVSNPKLSHVKEAIRIVKEKKLQAVVAVGGGLVLDSAKAIAAGAKYDGDVWDFFINKAVTPTQSRNPWGRRIWAQDNGRL